MNDCRGGWRTGAGGRVCAAALCVLVGAAAAARAGEDRSPATQPSRTAIADAVKRLGDAAWRTREAAQKELTGMGEAAIEALEQAFASDDAEVRQRAASILQEIRRDLLDGASQAMEKARVWKAPAKEGVASPAVASGETVCFLTLDGALRAVDAKTGKAKWAFDDLAKEVPANRNVNQTLYYGLPTLAPPVIADGQVYVAAQFGRIYALGLDKGDVKWKSATADGFAPPAAAGGRVYAAGTEKDLRAIDAATGKELWRADLEGGCIVRPVAIGGAVYVAARDNNLYAFDANSGARRTVGSELVKDATDLLATEDGGLVARTSEGVVRIDPSAGAAKWTYPLALDQQQARMIAVFQAQARAGGKNRNVRRQTEDTLVAAGGALYTSAAGEVHAIDAATGKSLWTFKPEAPDEDGGAGNQVININGGLVVIGGQGRFLLRGMGPGGNLSIPCVEGGMLYVASPAGLHGVDLKTRSELWRLEGKELVTVRPVVSGGVLYYGTADLSAGRGVVVAVGGANQPQVPDNDAGLHAVRLSTSAAAK